MTYEKRRKYISVGDRVEFMPPGAKGLEDDKIGTVIDRDGDYILVELDKSKVVLEAYPCELKDL